ncbi:phospholipase D-like domain-containing protein [Paenibacillus sp. NRS-1782]|uniref:phospholipase D-like domain-containing protein n=1 Tax=unclassified Paenibacillus TaxID=185978 RepID=UPI003D2B0482
MKITKIITSIALLTTVIGCTAEAAAPVYTANVQATFTEDHPDQALIDVINSADSTLDIAIYSLTQPDIVKAIRDAEGRDVTVRIIADKSQATGDAQAQALKLIKNAGIPVKVNAHSGLMHLKVTIADGKTVTTGSFNYSKAASTKNDEVLVTLVGGDVAAQFAEKFNAMWNDAERFKTY